MKEIENVMRHWIRFQSWFSFPWLRFIYHYVCCLYFGCIYHCISCTRKRQAKQSPQRLQLPSHWFSQDSVIRLLLHLIDLLSTIQGSKSSYFWEPSRPLKGLFSGSCKSIWAIWQSRPQTISNSCLFRNQYYFLLFVGCKNTESPIRSIYILSPAKLCTHSTKNQLFVYKFFLDWILKIYKECFSYLIVRENVPPIRADFFNQMAKAVWMT